MRPFSPQNATFTDGSPGVGSPGWYVNPRDVVSWMWSFDPYTFYVPQTTIAAKREPFEIASLPRVQLLLRGTIPSAQWAIFKRLSLGGYGDLACIKSIWTDSSSSGDKILRLAMSNGHVYSRVAPVNQCQFPIPRAKNGHFQSL